MAGFIQSDEEFQLLDVHLRSRVREGGDSSASGVIGRFGLANGCRGLGFYVWNPKPKESETMSLFSFLKEAGEKILDALTPDKAEANSEALTKHVQSALTGIDTSKIQVKVEGDKVIASGEAKTQEEKEKILLTLGNVAGVSGVEDQITVTGPVVVAAKFVVVEKGDTLSAISLRVYGNANLYNKIFEANKPMLKDVNKIYPGQSLRIPE
jgi:nucleoid-associated protein YgaU